MADLEIKKYDPEEEKKKITAWGGYGKLLYTSEIAFQGKAQQIINKLIDPTTPELIIEAERALAIVKKDNSTLIDARKAVTEKFDPVYNRLSQPEKDVLVAIKKNEAAILKAKIDQKNSAKLKEDKAKELKNIEQNVRLYVSDMNAAYLETHNKLINDSYKFALENKISSNNLEEFLNKVRNRITKENQVTPRPNPKFTLNTQEDVDEVVKKFFLPMSPEKYVEGFRADLAAKFSDWDNALRNPDLAEKLNEEEFKTTSSAILDMKEKEVVSVKLDTISTMLEPTTEGKSLKEVYKLKEPTSMDEADIIINAYCVLRKECRNHMRKISPINFSVKQMISALESLKNDDNSFSHTGLTFELINKI